MFSRLTFITVRFSAGLCHFSQKTARPLRSKKAKALGDTAQTFVDLKHVKAIGGRGGDGCISFLQLWSNEKAGPDGGDGGNGGHVIFEANKDVKHLANVPTVVRAESGEHGRNKDCHGSNAEHLIIKVPTGTVIKNKSGNVVGDLETQGLVFIAARGGAGGKGNHFFISDTMQAPNISEYGAIGENLEYTLEIKSIAHVGLIGYPNAGKSTLLGAITRARPKVAPYPFTTLKPHIGMVPYDDYKQIAVADLPGLIENSHKNRGLGIQFLKHAERCLALLYVIDLSEDKPWEYLEMLQYELSQYNESMLKRPQLVIGNKMDLPEARDNLELIKKKTDLKVIPISAKLESNLVELLQEIKILYEENNNEDDK